MPKIVSAALRHQVAPRLVDSHAAGRLSLPPGGAGLRERLTTLAGLDYFGIRNRIDADEAKPRTKAQLVELLRNSGEEFAAWLETLTPEFLGEMVTEPDGKTAKSRFERLLSAKEHEMHHRGQLMLVERQLGIVPHVTRQFQERLAQMQAAKA